MKQRGYIKLVQEATVGYSASGADQMFYCNLNGTYPLPRPGTYPRGAGTPIKDFFFLFNKDIFSTTTDFVSVVCNENNFQYGGCSLVFVTFRKTATDQYKPHAGSAGKEAEYSQGDQGDRNRKKIATGDISHISIPHRGFWDF